MSFHRFGQGRENGARRPVFGTSAGPAARRDARGNRVTGRDGAAVIRQRTRKHKPGMATASPAAGPAKPPVAPSR
jgi:hypothetical protein